MRLTRIMIGLVSLLISVVALTTPNVTRTLLTSAVTTPTSPSAISPETSAIADTICLSIDKTQARTAIHITAQAVDEKIFGLAFSLFFDADRLEFTRYTAGTFFEKADTPLYLVKEGQPGAITAGISLRRGAPLVSGSGRILSLEFKETNPSYDDFFIDNVVVSTLTQNGREDIHNLSWKMCEI